MKQGIKITFLFSILILSFFAQVKASDWQDHFNTVQVEKKFTTWDFVYEPTIKTVLLFPYTGQKADYLEPAVSGIDQSKPFLLSFDDLKEDPEYYNVKIIHCNSDWSVSSLSSIQYLDDFNEFTISDRRTSISTKIPYLHYQFFLPKVKISGNYVVKVYRNFDEEDLILTKRFMVYDNRVIIHPDIHFPQKVSERNESQQVDFTISYPNYPLINPNQNLKVHIRQNFRWDKSIMNLPPLFTRENASQLDYNYFNMENGFKGGNEFNVFDISSLITSRLNVGKIVNKPEYYEVILLQDRPRAGAPYELVPDIDGKYFIDQWDIGDEEISSDYAYVTFVLDAPVQPGRVFVVGGMNDFRLEEEFEMVYDPDIKKYYCRAFIKQGYYNYRFALVNDAFPYGNDLYFCGSHSQTQNQYEILAYYRPPGERADLLIGYTRVNFMSRR